MRKRYSRSYTVLSFLTMFSYRELPFGGLFFLLPPAGYFLSRKKVPKERFKGRGISISPERALRVRPTIFAKQKSVF